MVTDRHRLAAYHNKHWWRAFRGYQQRWPWTTLNPQNMGFKWFFSSEFSLKYTGDRPRQPVYEIKLMLWRVSWALAQISCFTDRQAAQLLLTTDRTQTRKWCNNTQTEHRQYFTNLLSSSELSLCLISSDKFTQYPWPFLDPFDGHHFDVETCIEVAVWCSEYKRPPGLTKLICAVPRYFTDVWLSADRLIISIYRPNRPTTKV